MKSAVWSAAAVSLLATATFSGTADARCWWTGHHLSCVHSPYHHHAYRHYYRPYGLYYSLGQYAASRLGPEPGGGFYHMGKSNIGKTD